MKKVGFIGGFDKTDLIIYIAKMLREVGKKILIVDTTVNQRARYIIPTILPKAYYVTEFEGVDIAIGFSDLEEIKKYLCKQELEYDIILIDIDSKQSFQRFDIPNANKNFFVTAFDNYSLKKGLEIVGKLPEKITMTKILYSRDILKEDDDYLNFLSFYFSIKWNKEKIYLPYEQGDYSIIIENQRAAKISFKRLSLEYKQGILEIVEQIYPEGKNSEFKRTLRNI